MPRAIRDNALCVLMALAGSLAVAWLTLYGFAWNDYEVEAKPAVDALLAGHLSRFVALAPAYGGSLVVRAPFALLAVPFGGGALATYRLLALPCLLAAAGLGVFLVADMRSRGSSTLARAVALALCVANPITLNALELGHPEELLGGALCVAGVLLAARGRALTAGVLIGLAIANKQSALLAVGPAMLCLAPGTRLRFLAVAGGLASALLAPLLLGGSAGFVAGTKAVATPSSTIFQPWQAWWFLGHHGALVHGLFGAGKPGFRIAPAWIGPLSHPLIVLLGAVLPAALWLRRRSAPGRARASAVVGEREALLMLALVLLLRCELDTWDITYYTLPFLLALLALETTAAPHRPPLLSLSATVLVWISFVWLRTHASADVQAAFFLAWALPLTAGLGLRLLGPAASGRERERTREDRGRRHETTVSSLGRLVSNS
jgi:hypothetical protein